MKIYISGQITGLNEEEYTSNFNWAVKKVCATTYCMSSDVINPLSIRPSFGVKKWLFFMIADLMALRSCTHIAMQPNWIYSKGAVIEYFFARFIYKLKIIWL